MTLIIYKLYFFLSRVKRSNINKKNIKYLFSLKIIGYIEAYFNIFLVNYYRKKKNQKFGLNEKNRSEKIIISLTSFPKRIDTVWITIETLMSQSMKADKIILWLAEEQFPNKLNDLPKSLLNQRSRGLTIRFCDDLRSHKKYFYTMQEYVDDLIVLVDDDMFYPSDTIKKLYKLHKKKPKDICVITTQKISPNILSMPSKWENPKLNELLESTYKAQIFTGSGSLYVPHCLDDDVFNKELLLRICPYADDLWLTFMALKKGTRISSLSKWRSFPISIYGTNEGSLYYINAENKMNDQQWQNLINNYSNEFKRLEKQYNE